MGVSLVVDNPQSEVELRKAYRKYLRVVSNKYLTYEQYKEQYEKPNTPNR